MNSDTFSARVYRFYTSLVPPSIPRGVSIMNPYADVAVRKYVCDFLNKYFDDKRKRMLILGINPGRLGAGVTGVTFTDPIALKDHCGIANELPRRPELSATFVYQLINRMGGPVAFYRRFFLSAVCPLGFTRNGINVNYYDENRLKRALTPFIVDSIERHIKFGGRKDHVVVLGSGKNADYLRDLNRQHRWFAEIHSLDHPRFIMQYRRRRVDAYIGNYQSLLGSID